MNSSDLGHRQLQGIPIMDSETRFKVQMVSGSLLMGSSVAYPILSQDESHWSSVALCTFFLSAASFNSLQMFKILLYGQYTLVVCVVGMIMIMTFGHNTVADHVQFIPVYAMGSSFLTAAWPSLGDSWTRMRSNGYEHLPMHDASEPSACPYVPMAEIQVDSLGQAAPRTSMSMPGWLADESRQRSSPSPVSPPSSLGGGEPRPGQWLVSAWLRDTQHMGPASDRSQVRTHTGTSISLSSRQTVPSEISANALELLCPGGPAQVPRTTQRRLDINSLGQGITLREESLFSSRVADRSCAL